MNNIMSRRVACSAIVALMSLNAYAQSGAVASAPAAGAASAPKVLKAANHALEKAVIRALSKTKGLRSSAITVRANNGVVTLEGTVPEESQVDLATHAAEGVSGVTLVKNALTLSTF